MPFRPALYTLFLTAALLCTTPVWANDTAADTAPAPSSIDLSTISTDPGALPFNFMDIQTVSEMETYLKAKFPLGTPRDDVRKVLVKEGKATLFQHPRYYGVEKYLYDVNLCYYYMFRWNISADYDKDAKLERIYLNGNELYGAQDPIIATALKDKVDTYVKQRINRVKRPRPEAYKGEGDIKGLIYDRDGDMGTADDQKAITAGPSRADPLDMGTEIIYKDVLPWRSILDHDDALSIGKAKNCLEADIKNLGIQVPPKDAAQQTP